MISKLIHAALEGAPLSPAALEDAIHAIVQGQVEPAVTAGLLVALAGRPVEPALLAAAARALRAHAVSVHPRVRPLVDTCGTGGDGAGTFNISTAAALVVAATGAAVAKHGNRGVSSKVGSADVLDAAGCGLSLSAGRATELLDATGFAFLFAPDFHPAMARVATVRRALGIRTLFNLLGPLVNPAGAEQQLLGVYAPELTEPMARALAELGSRAAWVVHCDGLDELGLHGVTRGHRLVDGRIEPLVIDPAELGLAPATLAELAGGEDASSAARILRGSLGDLNGAPGRVVALNAAAALTVAGRVPGLAEGLEEARAVQASGEAARVLERYAASSSAVSVTAAGARVPGRGVR